jgi:pyruvate/2-oxoglutarate dehydrogenase complex dihydrolipoamide dehydrogenase (E3) component
MKAVKARKDAVVAASRNGVERSLKTLQGCTVYQGHGRFVAEKKVVVDDSELAAINDGSPRYPVAMPPLSPGRD